MTAALAVRVHEFLVVGGDWMTDNDAAHLMAVCLTGWSIWQGVETLPAQL